MCSLRLACVRSLWKLQIFHWEPQIISGKRKFSTRNPKFFLGHVRPPCGNPKFSWGTTNSVETPNFPGEQQTPWKPRILDWKPQIFTRNPNSRLQTLNFPKKPRILPTHCVFFRRARPRKPQIRPTLCVFFRRARPRKPQIRPTLSVFFRRAPPRETPKFGTSTFLRKKKFVSKIIFLTKQSFQ